MPDPAFPLPEVVITGQRARGPSPFAGLSYPSTGSSGPHSNTLDPADPEVGEDPPPTDEENQCADPEARKEWNKDAVAAKAPDKLLEYARRVFNENSFSYREYGALICEYQGHIDLGPIEHGPYVGPPIGGRGSVPIDPAGCGAGTPVGFVHSHNSGNSLPSTGDMDYLQYLVDNYHADPMRVSVYTVTPQLQPGQTEPVNSVTRVPLTDRDAVAEPGYEPDWVNPEAEECPGNGG